MDRLKPWLLWLAATGGLYAQTQPVVGLDINPATTRCTAIAPVSMCLEYQLNGAGGGVDVTGSTLVTVHGPEEATGAFQLQIVSPPVTGTEGPWIEMRRPGIDTGGLPGNFSRLPAAVELVLNESRVRELRGGRFIAYLLVRFDGVTAPYPPLKVPIQLTVNPRQGGFRMMQDTIPEFSVASSVRPEQQRFFLRTEPIGPELPTYRLQVATDTSTDGGQVGVDMRWYLTGCSENPPPCEVDALLQPTSTVGEHWAVWAFYGGGYGDRATARYRVTPRTADMISILPAAISVSAEPGSTRTTRTEVAMGGGGFDGVLIQATRSESWLEVSPSRATWPLTLAVTVNPEGLAPGIYRDSVQVRVDGGGVLLASIPVTLSIVAPTYAPVLRDGGGWRTSFVLVNASPAPALANLRFRNADGSPLALPVAGGGDPAASVNTLIPAGGMRVVETAGPEAVALRQGWAELRADASVSMRVILRQSGGTASNVVEATVPMANPWRDGLLMPFDQESGAIDSIALANPDSQPVTVKTNLLNEDGTAMIAETEFTLGAGATATYPIATQWPASAKRRGVLSLSYPGGRLLATGYRESGRAFTAFPVAGRGLAGVERGMVALAAGGAWQSTVYLTNGSAVNQTGSFRVWPDTTRGKDTGLNEELARTVPANGVTVWEAAPRESSPGTAERGWLESRYQKDVSGYVLLRRTFSGNEAATPAPRETAHGGTAGFTGRVAMPFDNRNGLRTSIAIVNTADEPTEVQTFIWDAPGRSRRFGETFRLPARGQLIVNTTAAEWELAGQQGTIEFASRQGFRLTAAGLRVGDNSSAVFLPPYEK